MIRKIQLFARMILGLIYFVFGGMGLAIALGLMAMPAEQPMPEAARGFMHGILGAVYFFPLLKVTETVGGLFLLIGRGAPMALVVLAPITLNIFLFHAFLTPGLTNLILPLFMLVAHVTAMGAYAGLYKPLLSKG